MLDDEVVIEVVVGSGTGRGHSTVLRMSWQPAEPLAVSFVVTPRPDHPALPSGSWVVLRDFLRYGMEEPTGDGAVRIRPSPDGAGVELELSRGTRPCSLAVPMAVVRDFLSATEAIVPTGEEASEQALDALIERLLQD